MTIETKNIPVHFEARITALVKSILRAPIYDLVQETPLIKANLLSERFGNQIQIKREDLQPVFSFKLRGAYHRLLKLDEDQKKNPVIAASAGNHAQGLAMSATHLGLHACILMPVTTPEIKVDSVRRLGAEVILHGDTFDEAYEGAQRLEKARGYTFIHPYDDEHVIAGQGTVALEALRQSNRHIDTIFIPVGGGGLIAGMAAYIKYLSPKTRVIGVEPEDAACLFAALEANKRVTLKEVGLFADGVAVKQIGKTTFEYAQVCVDEVVKVNTDEICAAIKDIYEDTRSISEPAGALAIAGLKKYIHDTGIQGKNLVAVNSGANMNFDRLRNISERTALGEGREALLAVTIPEEIGSFKRFCTTIGKRSISEFNYRYADHSQAKVYVGVQMLNRETELPKLIHDLKSANYPVVDMTDNELAKIHVRHMVGGRSTKKFHEVLYRFEFPERPGALLAFLEKMGQRWNISLFHYRNHGAAYGRVLVGFNLLNSGLEIELTALHSHFDELGYRYFEETDNPAVQAFLV